ncbi:membrane protein [Thraustotheca clavata]|uniref:Membrane protein n=1 Tax=Thraustotheca clavata TaxID=74557 RepID=A0A1V9ZZT4_9STRA|nr:membrane protein [Thraustotheca clavata]
MGIAKGVGFAVLAYFLWGFQPIYWKQLLEVNSYQLVLHRVVWSFPVLVIFLIITGQFRPWLKAACQLKTYKVYSVSALLLGSNFFLSLWGVNSGHILQVSLGYFINPLVSVVLGVVFLKERLPVMQWVVIGIAMVGVVVVTIGYGEFPWISLSIAAAFGFYGLVQKKAPLTGLQGVSIELMLLSIPCIIILIILDVQGTGAFGHSGAKLNWLMVGCGLATILPQLCFTTALETVPLTIVGVAQFIGPSIQTLLGVVMYHENFSITKAIGFGCVWVSLILFTYYGLRDKFKPKPPSVDESVNVDSDIESPQNTNYRNSIDDRV